MPIETADRLLEIEEALLIGAGASEEEAKIVARHSIDSNLAGHDSHGIIKIPTYIQRVKDGHVARYTRLVNAMAVYRRLCPVQAL